MTCPLCDSNCVREHLSEGWMLCARLKLAYKVDAQGDVAAWATTSKSHPKGIWTERGAPGTAPLNRR
jgi:hypothetical protein